MAGGGGAEAGLGPPRLRRSGEPGARPRPDARLPTRACHAPPGDTTRRPRRVPRPHPGRPHHQGDVRAGGGVCARGGRRVGAAPQVRAGARGAGARAEQRRAVARACCLLLCARALPRPSAAFRGCAVAAARAASPRAALAREPTRPLRALPPACARGAAAWRASRCRASTPSPPSPWASLDCPPSTPRSPPWSPQTRVRRRRRRASPALLPAARPRAAWAVQRGMLLRSCRLRPARSSHSVIQPADCHTTSKRTPAPLPLGAGIVQMVTADIEPEEVPFEPGHLKLRGFPPQLTKEHIVAFLRVRRGAVLWRLAAADAMAPQ